VRPPFGAVCIGRDAFLGACGERLEVGWKYPPISLVSSDLRVSGVGHIYPARADQPQDRTR